MFGSQAMRWQFRRTAETGRPNRTRWALVAGFAVIGLAATALAVLYRPTPANAACVTNPYRAGDFAAGVTTAKGVHGVLRTPYSGEVTGAGTNRPSAADIYLISNADFVQLGWYLGSASQLPTVTTPYVFVGEFVTGGELLRQGQALSWNTYYTFDIEFSSTPGTYYFYVNGQYKFATTTVHAANWQASFTGEVGYNCTTMRGRAYASASPLRTLKYLTSGGGGSVWHYFVDSRFADTGYFSISGGDSATDYAYGS